MTLAEAKRILDTRLRLRCDGYRVFWSLTDVAAARLLLEAVKEREDDE